MKSKALTLNGILHVNAKEESTGKSLKIQEFSGLSENDIEELRKNANRSSF